MRIIGLMPVRNEAWCLEVSLRTALRWCDAVVVLLHECTDDSQSIVCRLGKEFDNRLIVDATDGPWREMQHRESMLQCAREIGGTHIAIVDADEITSANIDPRPLIEALQPGEMLTLPLYNLRGSLWRYHANGIWANRWVSVAWKDTGKEHWTGDQFHHREPWGQQWRHVKPIQQGQGGVCHLWGASERRLIAKHVTYKITEALRWPHKPKAEIRHMYGLAFENAHLWSYANVPEEWWGMGFEELEKLIDLKHVPWQESWNEHMLAIHGREKFAGLNLHGLDK